jgi:hypothetical protein
MNETTVTLPAPVLELPPPVNKWEREHRAFQRLLPELLKSQAGKYVAIHDEQVVDSDTNELALIERMLGRVGNVSIHVGLVTEQTPPPIRVPHYRQVKRQGGGT